MLWIFELTRTTNKQHEVSSPTFGTWASISAKQHILWTRHEFRAFVTNRLQSILSWMAPLSLGMAWRARDHAGHCSKTQEVSTLSLSISVGLLFLGILLNLVRSLFVFLADLVELLHVFEKVGASLQSDKKLGFLAVTTVVGGLHGNGFSSDLLEGGILVPKNQLVRIHSTNLSAT